MSVQPTESVLPQFDHHSDQANADPIAYYDEFRAKCPVGRTDAHDGFLYTTRYADIARIARDDETFSSSRAPARGEGTVIVIPRGAGLEQFPIELDPPESVAYRDLINPLLTVEAIDRLRPMIARHTTRVIDAFIESGSCDFVDDLTNPLPASVTLDWLGFPEQDWAPLAAPIHDIFAAVAGSERAIRGGLGLAFMDQRIRELIAERRAEPREDAISYLVAQRRPDGELFSVPELVSVIGLLIAGGVDTTTSLTGSTLVHLHRNHEDRERLIESPDLLDVATEEFLRAFAPSQSMARTALHDTSIGGCPVAHGDRVLIPWVAANYDPEVFPNPHEVILDRDPKRHLSFGIGTHRCAGAHLARAMFREMTTQVLTRLPDYVIDEAGLINYPTSGNQVGWDAMPATFRPGPIRGATTTVAAGIGTAFEMEIAEVVPEADDVISLRLRLPGGGLLPEWQPGAHLELRLPSGRLRQYSLCGSPADRTSYTVAVLREHAGRGGSVEVHAIADGGVGVTVRGPRNHFKLVDAPDYLFIAGGIGVTPILAMVREVSTRNASFRMIYGGRTRSSMAFTPALSALAGDRVTFVPQDEAGIPDIAGALATVGPETAIYCCGPGPMINAVEQACADAGLAHQLHIERFTASGDEIVFDPADNTAFDVELVRSGVTAHVPADKRLIEVIRENIPGISYDCEQGYCGACETRVLGGVPVHRDTVLTDEEKAAAHTMMICVGRCSSEKLVLDL
jgi:cytochrome P450/ferredoxin-NADP reductase